VASDDELSLVYEHFANIDEVARLSVSIHQCERQFRPAAHGIEQLLSDMAGNVRIFAQGHPWGARGGAWGRRGDGCRRRCARKEATEAQDQEGQGQAVAAEQPAHGHPCARRGDGCRRRCARQEASVAQDLQEAQDHEAVVEQPAQASEPPTLVSTDLSTMEPVSLSGTESAANSEDWNLVDEVDLLAAEAAAPSAVDVASPCRQRRQQRRSVTEDKVAVLQSMGFPQDQATLAALLRRHQGEVAGVVAELFAARD